ncbi:glycosyltransferase family 4 protein [Pseudopedobacter beijingensis]|uniref:Glycosyltransferase family 4 protein n=1 Tax=Pseudopedobacter beijingensis TaxID=1207056 RepID=A0ABW4IA66_9SPHI
MKKVLFITPFFGRTGSEMLLFYTLKNIDKSLYKPYLFTRNDGVLLKELSEDITAFIGYKKHKNFLYRIFRLLLYVVNINPIEYQLKAIHKKVKPDFWYINTIANRDAYNIAKKLNAKVISHVHELPLSYNLVKGNTIKNIIHHSLLCIGCSKIVCEKLEDMGHENVRLLYGFVDDSLIKIRQSRDQIRTSLKLDEQDFVWVISGATNMIKGIDFLIPLMKKLKSNHKIVWIGSNDNGGTSYYAEESVKNKYADRVLFIGKKSDDYYDYLNVGNAYLSLSREDSYPLVLLEAAHLGMPIVGFNSGGIKEFVTEKIGYVVDQLSFDELANKMALVEAEYQNFDSEYIKAHVSKINASTQMQKLISLLDDFSK